MNILHLDNTPDCNLAKLLADFEQAFRYPLGPGRSFRISHGEDYTRFFRAIGPACSFVAEDAGQIHGVISIAKSQVQLPGGKSETVAYVCDLKASPAARGGTVVARLLQTSFRWAAEFAQRGFSIVMDGTAAVPKNYTGRLGIPSFDELTRIMILRLDSSLGIRNQSVITTTPDVVRNRFRELTVDACATVGGSPESRSEMVPLGLLLENGWACGVLEDTRRAKRLFDDADEEIVSAHLSSFAYRSYTDAAVLVFDALNRCQEAGIPALFLAVPHEDGEALLAAMGNPVAIQAPATIFGIGFPLGCRWYVNTSEI